MTSRVVDTGRQWTDHAGVFVFSISLENRDSLLDNLYAELEQNMQLIGATAINDKLQDGVPHTIAQLLDAGIRFWILTGDKQGVVTSRLSVLWRHFKYFSQPVVAAVMSVICCLWRSQRHVWFVFTQQISLI